MLTCGEETWVVTVIRKILCTAEGSIDHTNVKDEHERGKHPFLWSQISNHAIIALTNPSYRPPIPTLHTS